MLGEDVGDSDSEDNHTVQHEAYNDLVSEDDYIVFIVDVDGFCFPSFLRPTNTRSMKLMNKQML